MRRVWLIAAASLLIPGSVEAQWRASAFIGHAATRPADLTVTSPGSQTAVTLFDVPLDHESFGPPIYYGWRIGRFFTRTPWLGVEGEFIHAKVISRAADPVRMRGRLRGVDVEGEQPVGSVLPRFELSHGFNFLLVNAVVRVPMAGNREVSRLAFVARGGAGPTLPHVEATFGAEREDAYQRGQIAWHASAGVDVRLTDRLSLVAEVKWTTSRQRLTVAETDVNGTMRTVHVVTGLGWRF